MSGLRAFTDQFVDQTPDVSDPDGLSRLVPDSESTWVRGRLCDDYHELLDGFDPSGEADIIEMRRESVLVVVHVLTQTTTSRNHYGQLPCPSGIHYATRPAGDDDQVG